MTARPRRRGNWSVQELTRLRQLLPRRGVEDTARLLRRSADSVRRKALTLLRVPLRKGGWTEADDALLRSAYGVVDLRLLGVLAGRAPTEVARRAEQLRMAVRSGPWERHELSMLKELYGTRDDGDLEVCLQRPRAEIEAEARRLCLAKDKRFASRQAARLATPSPAMPRWRADEIALLRQVYPEHDNLEVARLLNRTVAAVANKANLLGLEKSLGLLARLGRANVAIRHAATAAARAAAREAAAGTAGS